MMRIEQIVTSMCLVGVVCVFAGSAQAQTRRPQPFGGLFGTNAEGDGHSLELRGSLFGSLTDNVLADISDGGLRQIRVDRPADVNRSFYYGLQGSLAYGFTRAGERGSLAVNAGTAGGYYPDLDLTTARHSAGIDVSRAFGGRTRVQLAQDVSASPHYRFALFPDPFAEDSAQLIVAGDEFVVLRRDVLTYTTSAGLSHALSRRTSLSAGYEFRYGDFHGSDQDLERHRPTVSLRHALTKYATLRGGYHYEQASFGGSAEREPFRTHGVDLGVDYNRAFSISGRRTTLTFGTGSALVAGARQVERQDETQDKTVLRPWVHGSAKLQRNLGRTWDAVAAYQRTVQFIEGFSDPVFADSVSVGLGGYLAPRITFNAFAGYSTGRVGLDRDRDNSHGSRTASAMLSAALTRHVAAYAQYLYVQHRLGADVVVPTGFARSLDRQSLRVGLTAWLPLIR